MAVLAVTVFLGVNSAFAFWPTDNNWYTWCGQGNTVTITRIGVATQSSTNITHAYFKISSQPHLLAFEIETPKGRAMYATLLLAYNKGTCNINFWAYAAADITLQTGELANSVYLFDLFQ